MIPSPTPHPDLADLQARQLADDVLTHGQVLVDPALIATMPDPDHAQRAVKQVGGEVIHSVNGWTLRRSW